MKQFFKNLIRKIKGLKFSCNKKKNQLVIDLDNTNNTVYITPKNNIL
jgi:hypothetical protein